MVRRYIFCVLLVFIAVGTVAAQTQGCEVPDGMTKEQKLPCVRAGRMLLDQPTLSPTQLANGPGFDGAEPEKSRFACHRHSPTALLGLCGEALPCL